MLETKTFSQEILIEAGSSSRNHILGGFPYNGNLTKAKISKFDIISFRWTCGKEPWRESSVSFQKKQKFLNIFPFPGLTRRLRSAWDCTKMSGRSETSSTGKMIKTSSDFSCVLVFSRRGIYGLDEEEIVELGRQMIDIHFATRWSDNHIHFIMKCLLNEEHMVSQVPHCHLWSIRKGQVPRPSLNLSSQGCHKAEHQGKHCQFNVKRKQNKTKQKLLFPRQRPWTGRRITPLEWRSPWV